MEHIDCVYYMNLDHREDRRAQIEGELDKLGVPQAKQTRIPGIYKPGFGILGCGLAHKRAIETFLASPHKTCLIFEDDFEFTVDMDYVHMLLDSIFQEGIKFDCIMLAGVILEAMPTAYPFLLKVLNAHTASGYLITKEFAPTLLESYTESTRLLEDTYNETGVKEISYHNDIYWKKYQASSRWFLINPRIGEQRQSYSDNLERDLKYGF
jgi:GR25 family glycosyltransferase involved in LPS biosynthesis